MLVDLVHCTRSIRIKLLTEELPVLLHVIEWRASRGRANRRWINSFRLYCSSEAHKHGASPIRPRGYSILHLSKIIFIKVPLAISVAKLTLPLPRSNGCAIRHARLGAVSHLLWLPMGDTRLLLSMAADKTFLL